MCTKGVVGFCDIKTYDLTSLIKNIDTSNSFHNLIETDNDKLFVGGEKTISILDTKKFIIDKKITFEGLLSINCFIKLKEERILCGCSIGDFKGSFLSIGQKDFEFLGFYKNAHSKLINNFLKISENSFATCSRDGTVKIWNI